MKNDCKRKQEELSQLKRKRAKIDGSVKNRKKTIQSYAPGHKRLEEKLGVIAELERSRLPLQDQISSHTKSIEDMKIALSRVETDMKALGAKANKLRVEINDSVSERRNRENGADGMLDDILQNHNIPVKVWHGTTMTYGACRDLMTKCEAVMSDIEADWIGRIRERNKHLDQDEHEACRSYTEEEAKQIIEKVKDMLLVQDVLFSHVRTMNPTWKEVKRVRRSIKMLEKLIPEVGVSKTPKIHTELAHLVREMIRLCGLGDKVEEWLEKIHQMFKRMRYLTQRMPTGWESQMRTIHKYMWRDSDPFVIYEANRVKKVLERKLRDEKKSKAEKMYDRREERWNKLVEIQGKYLTAAEIAEDEITEEDERFVYTNDLLCTFVNSGEDNQEEA